MAAWRGFANLVLDRTKYVGTGRAGTNRAHTKQDMLDRTDAREHVCLWTTLETDVAPRDAFPIEMEDI